MNKPDYDLCVIGGGINGAGIARDAAGRGIKVLLVEKGDLAGATSSASTKLIHGGLRYLEYYEFHLVAEALREREILLGIAPHIVAPLEFVLPHDSHLRPAWMIRAGLFLYDHLAGRRRLQKSHGIKFAGHPYGAPLKENYKQGFTYADCRVDDSRLVILNAMDAASRGAAILTRTRCDVLKAEDELWHIGLTDSVTGGLSTHTASMIVNAGGPWVHDILMASNLATPQTPHVRLVKGSHIVLPRLYDGEQAYILQQPDRRIVFVIPYEQNFSMVGTTDENYTGDPAAAAISQGEIDYLCAAVNRSLKQPVDQGQIVGTWSGVRPLLDDGRDSASAVTRDYKLITDIHDGAKILSVFGGKITTYRHLAEEAVNKLCGGKPWTARAPLPGGDLPSGDFDTFLQAKQSQYLWLPADLCRRYAHQYGTRMDVLLAGRGSLDDLGAHYGGGLYETEVSYLLQHEWARTAEDILWRRTKLGFHVAPHAVQNLQKFLLLCDS
jgi:glycerol-3-phosphate dehydrogenase